MTIADCLTPPDAGLRHFWTTQPNACGEASGRDDCGNIIECGKPGLDLIPVYDPCLDARGCFVDEHCRSDNPPKLIGATIATNDFVRSLAINIIATDAERQPVGACAVPIGRRGGYWADAYRTDGLKTGSLLRQLPLTGTMQQLAKLAQQYLQRDLGKLITYGVASAVNVTATYIGGATISLEAEILGDMGPASVSVSGQKLANEWAWSI